MKFTMEEIHAQLESMGYHDVPMDMLHQIRRDLNQIHGQDEAPSPSPDPAEREADSEELKHHMLTVSSGKRGEHQQNRQNATLLSEREVWNATPLSMQSSSSSYSRVITTTNGNMRRKVAIKDGSHPYGDVDSISGSDYDTPTHSVQHVASQRVRVERHAVPHSSRRAHFHEDPVYDIKNYTAEFPRRLPPSLLVKEATKPQRPMKKNDPVERYHKYCRSWQVQAEPGRDGHKHLRWAVKAAMLVHEVPAAPTSARKTRPSNDGLHCYHQDGRVRRPGDDNFQARYHLRE